ncbi:MAG TPA: TonB family protein [Verrucomicrobiae bacterium]|jgi:TonB family protein|nr:TonB family protein [Verrucomicrobiae bacterium]
MPCRNWPAVLLLLVSGVALAANSSVDESHPATLQHRERKLAKLMVRASQFANVPHISALPQCEDVQPPEELATPDPLFAPGAHGKRVKVSFIIGVDGHVHSPLILESAGIAGDRHVLETVRTWRYRPATCNGIPTETEGKIEFSSH